MVKIESAWVIEYVSGHRLLRCTGFRLVEEPPGDAGARLVAVEQSEWQDHQKSHQSCYGFKSFFVWCTEGDILNYIEHDDNSLGD